MPYTPDATVTTEPLDSRPVASGAEEFRVLKAWIAANLATKSISVYSAPAGAYQFVVADNGRGVKKSDSATATVAPNGTVNFPVGAVVTVINDNGSNMTLAAGVGVTFRLPGTATTGNRTLAQYGVATLWQIATDVWYVFGSGVS